MKKQLPLILLGIITLGGVLFFRVKKVECSVASQECPEEIISKIQILENKSLFFTNFEEIFLTQTAEQPIYQIETIEKELPHTVRLNLKRESVLYKLTMQPNSESVEEYSFGNTGIELPNSSNQELLQVNWEESYSPVSNNEITTDIHSALVALALELEQLETDKATLNWISDSEIRLRIPTKPEFIFDSETLQTQSKKIDTILSSRELSEFENSAQEIDMRFELPVLRTGE